MSSSVGNKVPKRFEPWAKEHVMYFLKPCNGILLCSIALFLVKMSGCHRNKNHGSEIDRED